MVTGELDFEAIFGFDVPASDYVPIPFHEVTFFIWIIFIILIPIILNNMLVSTFLYYYTVVVWKVIIIFTDFFGCW